MILLHYVVICAVEQALMFRCIIWIMRNIENAYFERSLLKSFLVKPNGNITTNKSTILNTTLK